LAVAALLIVVRLEGHGLLLVRMRRAVARQDGGFPG